MVEISASLVKELRERSGAAMMDCKKALVESSGDFDKAFEWLRQKGVAVAGKKAARAASEGLVASHIGPSGRFGVIAEINCETDFVARNPEFAELAGQMAELIAKSRPRDVEALMKVAHGQGCVQDLIVEKIAKIGENIQVRRFEVIELESAHGVVGVYVHAVGGKMGALVALSADKEIPEAEGSQLAREIAMHIVSAKPQFISRDEIPQSVVDNERRIESGKADLAEKKPEIRDKIVQGRVDKIMAERCLLEQPFIKDPGQTIAQYLKSRGAAWGAALKPSRFALYILGESAVAQEPEQVGASH